MKFFLAFLLGISYVTATSAFFIPVCSTTNEKSCLSLNLPNLPFLDFFVSTATKKSEVIVEEIQKNPPNVIQSTIALLLQEFDNVMTPVIAFWREKIIPLFDDAYKFTIRYLNKIDDKYIQYLKASLKYLPWFKYEEKAKADSKLYFLFIISSLGVYLVLYAYFSKKLCFYYQTSLRKQYLYNVKKIFKNKD